MDALILSCGTGGGHNAAARAIEEELINRGHRAVFLNPYSLVSDKLAKTIDGIYMYIAQKIPKLFGFIYGLGNIYRKLPFRSPVYHLNKKMNHVMAKYLSENHFDCIIMPHLFPAEILTNMKNHGMKVPKMFFIATDYTCIPFTEETDCDAYIIPSGEFTEEYILKGIKAEKLQPLGIPVKYSFRSGLSETEAKCRLGLQEDKKYILLSGGSMGSGKLVQAIKAIDRGFKDKSVKMIVICGTNERLYKYLTGKYGSKIILLKSTDKMAEYMAASRLFISKPGGLSSTEAAVSECALIHFSPIPGCELQNLKFFKSRGMSVEVRSIKKDIVPAVVSLLKDYSNMKKAQLKYINKNAACDICEYIENFGLAMDIEM